MENNPVPINKRPPVDITDSAFQIRQVEATMAMEGFILTEENKQTLRDIDAGKITVDEALEKIRQRYKR